jgi:hypothetical protein
MFLLLLIDITKLYNQNDNVTNQYLDKEYKRTIELMKNVSNDSLFITFESYRFSFYDKNVYSLYMYDNTTIHSLIEKYKKEDFSIYYIDTYSSNFVYSLNNTREQFLKKIRKNNKPIIRLY